MISKCRMTEDSVLALALGKDSKTQPECSLYHIQSYVYAAIIRTYTNHHQCAFWPIIIVLYISRNWCFFSDLLIYIHRYCLSHVGYVRFVYSNSDHVASAHSSVFLWQCMWLHVMPVWLGDNEPSRREAFLFTARQMPGVQRSNVMRHFIMKSQEYHMTRTASLLACAIGKSFIKQTVQRYNVRNRVQEFCFPFL